ncbi:sugar transferase [Aggregatimonas sangjinii]|uniref:Sugar transferase n=1 Tax=Aggregatimonas sangjinii TaxID=2583587 RepID=A0A5B7SM13_9FLAO|nr:sugar transferase [Aggregatimonas sangjinii]QCW99675.1 sugar transferase [Aggregatimonas sangjinii]
MKRISDIFFSAIGILVICPFLVLISIIIKLGSKGPVLYKQVRVGKGNKDFRIWKFRTMYTGSDKKGLLTVGDRDSRVTKAGLFLRKLKLDELPQLFNVLFGEMSLVGPRPEVRKYVDLYSEEDLIVLSVRPGITDYASIHFRNENEILKEAHDPEQMYIEQIMPEKLALNKKYILERSYSKDIQIILKTLRAVLGN